MLADCCEVGVAGDGVFGDGVPPPAQTRFDCEESEELGVDGELMALSIKRKL